jgi:hypothetical protein
MTVESATLQIAQHGETLETMLQALREERDRCG